MQALQWSPQASFWSRPVIRLFATRADWNKNANNWNKVGEGQFGTLGARGLGDAPGDGAVIGDAHDKTLLAGHQGSGSIHQTLSFPVISYDSRPI